MRTAMPFMILLATLGCDRQPPNLTPYEDPELAFVEPETGQYAEPGSFVAFGTYRNLESVQVFHHVGQSENAGDGGEATLDAGQFTRQVSLVRGANVVEAIGIDLRGDQRWLRHGLLAGTFAPPIFEVPHASLVRVNEDGVDELFETLSTAMEPALVTNSLAAVNPVYQETFRLQEAEIATVTIAVTDIDWSSIEITGDPKPDQATLLVTFDNLEIDSDVFIEGLGNAGTVKVDLWAETTDLNALITLQAVDGKLDVTLVDAAVNFEEFGWDSSLISSSLVGELTTQGIETALEDKLAEALAERVATTLEEVLTELDLSFESELLGTPFEAEATFAEAGIDDDGIYLTVDAFVNVQGDANYSYPGYLVHGSIDPVVDRTSDIAASINDDFLNRVLFEAWRAGMLVQNLSTADGSLSAGTAQALGADEATLSTYAKLAPVIIERDGQLQVQIAELDVRLVAPGSGFGDELDFAVAAWVDLSPVIKDGVLSLEIGSARTKVQVRETSTAASEEALTVVLEDALPIELMLALVTDIAIPIPDFAGVSIGAASTQRDAAGFHTHISIDLD